jgi:hypothetical protein
MNIDELIAQDAIEQQQAIRPPSDADLRSVGDLANKQLKLESRLDEAVIADLELMDPSVPELEALLKKKKEELSKVKEYDLPNAVQAFGLSEFKLLDGSLVTIKEDVYAGITEENREDAFEWLEATGNDGIIKNEVKCPFGKGQDAEAKRLADILSTQGYSFTSSRSVHPSTLKAFVRKQLEEGLPIPTDVFSIHVKKIASIKVKK